MRLQKLLAGAVTAGLIAGFFAATPALADDDDRRKPVAVEVSPRVPVQVRAIAAGTPPDPARLVFFDEVPDGKRLVMQHVSLDSLTAGAGGSVTCKLRVITGLLPPSLEVQLDLIVIQLAEKFTAEGPITLYAEAGDEVLAVCRGFDNGGEQVVINTLGTLVGYLVKVEQDKHDDDD